jgi:hypothetical protein
MWLKLFDEKSDQGRKMKAFNPFQALNDIGIVV